MAKLIRQGDILLYRIDKLPKGVVKTNNVVLAEGEVTGHKHQIRGSVQVFEEPASNQKYVKVGQAAQLVHEEHDVVNIGRGVYKVVRERELDVLTDEIRQVND